MRTDLMSPERIAMQYDGNKRKIAAAVQAGILDPTSGVLAGMFIDRMRAAAVQEQGTPTTVEQDVLGAPQMPAQSAALGATPQAQQLAQGQARAMQAMPPAERGVAALPVDESMVPSENYAGGGIVAFGRGDLVGQGVNEPFEGESWWDYTKRRAAESFRAPWFSEEGTMPRAGMSEAQYDALKKARENEQLYQNILSGKAPVPVRSSDATLMREATPPGAYPDETLRGRIPGSLYNVPKPAAPAAPAAPKEEVPTATAAPAREIKSVADLLAEREALLPKGEAYAGAEKQILEDRAKRAEDKTQSGWLRLAEAGFGSAAGTSRFAAANFGKGFADAMKGYADDLKEQKKLDREDRKFLSDIEQARRLEKIGRVDKAVDSYEKAAKLLSDEDRTRMTTDAHIRAQQMQLNKPSMYSEVRADLLSTDPKRQAIAKQYLGQGKTGSITEDDIYKAWNDAQKDPAAMMQLKKQGITNYGQFAAAQRAMISGVGGAGWGIRELGR